MQLKEDSTGLGAELVGFRSFHVPGITAHLSAFYKMALMSNYISRLLHLLK